jgi:hypothetical protein
MNVPTTSLETLWLRRNLGEPHWPRLKKEFPNITLWPRTPNLNWEKTQFNLQPLRSHFWIVPQIDLLAQLLRSGPPTGYVHTNRKRTRKTRDDQVCDWCWWCGQWRMSRTPVLLRCIHLSLERTRMTSGTGQTKSADYPSRQR